MCGITGYIGDQDALPLVRTGLQNLEYRGYDSAGIAADTGELSIYKRSGKVKELLSAAPESADARRAIGHTRWSTHGPPTDTNAHPHTNCDGSVAVVHNGIVENYDTIKDELADHTFESDTDTEVIPHLISEYLDDGLTPADAVRETVNRLSGSYAIVVMVAGDDRIYAARNESPLVIGHGDDGMFLASDVTAFLEETQRVTYMQDGDLAVLSATGLNLYRHGEMVDPEIETLDWEADAAEKGGYSHYMLKEIHEQPSALRQTISGRLDVDAGEADLELAIPDEYLQSLDEIQIVACGTSYYAGEYAARLFEELANVRTTVTIASEYAVNDSRDPWRTLGLAVTQSGETADTLSAIRTASDAGMKTMAVTNTLGSSVTRETNESVFIRAGPEIGVAATKTFASQVATLGMLAVAFGRKRGELSRDRAATVLENLRSIPGAIQQVLDRDQQIGAVAEAYADSDSFFFIGRHLGYPVALEGALKLKEISYDHAEGFAAGELKHGPLALVTGHTPVLAVLTEGARPQETQNNVKEVQAREAPVIGATTSDYNRYLDETFSVPDVGVFSPLVANVYWQLFAYYVADLKDRSIDKPRNLAKSVTVE
ncbi:glutamine--fructose-6-phosphate transaminase (isomerizing) [Salinarchaeum sp. IM2453]|uniref:glutamine--fructose-6-phosphate transaminase (isomerizing) n=1 Tax=Salinarchaeum sp. IM2453 TaxID=2862870 RepID=UPI001C83788F|nr:glutamine--fructose-6-phosphate transaminase (isomerizing) [Salinarchaeum sp. IM2453]QZA89128.1 glutamine--fructose-6-phosphate transaminase (isomerizing) [Salinarchaeum sp. IM2453]